MVLQPCLLRAMKKLNQKNHLECSGAWRGGDFRPRQWIEIIEAWVIQNSLTPHGLLQTFHLNVKQLFRVWGIPWWCSVQWLRLCTSIARDTGSVAGQGTKIPHASCTTGQGPHPPNPRKKNVQFGHVTWKDCQFSPYTCGAISAPQLVESKLCKHVFNWFISKAAPSKN